MHSDTPSHLTTGFPSLDASLGARGLPRRRLAAFQGSASSVNQALALRAIAAVHRKGGVAAYVAGPKGLDRPGARARGVRVDELLVAQPESREDALEIATHLLRSGAVDLVVLDDIDLLPTTLRSVELKRRFEELLHRARYSPGAVVFLRSSTERGGFSNLLRYFASLICEVRAIGKGRALVKVLKDKEQLGTPFQQVEIDVLA